MLVCLIINWFVWLCTCLDYHLLKIHQIHLCYLWCLHVCTRLVLILAFALVSLFPFDYCYVEFRYTPVYVF